MNIRQGEGGGVCPTGPYPSTCMYYAVQACSSYMEDGASGFQEWGLSFVVRFSCTVGKDPGEFLIGPEVHQGHLPESNIGR